ncbi:hypothetical protein [Streptomyces sp. HPF1205]|uniref:hypothetical protein n=1 Tax=Streptomyces sp. HPF1205 TaxID=2873262 RepID=UPI001CEC95DB|nr:hypothetical protein [Streptomyces sp. HPF1205]
MTGSTTVRRALVAALAAVAAAAGPLPQLAQADTAPAELTIAPQQKAGPVGWPVTVGDATGYLLRSDSLAGVGVHYAWYNDDGSLAHDLGDLSPGPQATRLGDGSTLLWALVQGGTGVKVYDRAAETWNTYPLPAGRTAVQVLPTSSGWTVAATGAVQGTSPYAPQLLHLLDPQADGVFTDRPVTGWPAAGTTSFGAWRVAPGTAVMQFETMDPQWTAGLLDTDTASLTVSGPEDNAPLLNHDLFGWGADGAVELRPRSDPQSAPRKLSLPGPAGDSKILVLTDSVLLEEDFTSDQAHGTLYSVPLDGGPATVLLQDAGTLRTSADHGALVAGVDDTGAKVAYKVPAAGGAPTVVYRYPTHQPEHIGLSVARGIVSRAETGPDTSVTAYVSGTEVGGGAAPTLGLTLDDGTVSDAGMPRCDGGLRCLALADSDDGTSDSSAWVSRTKTGDDDVHGRRASIVIPGSHGGRIVSGSGARLLFDGSDGEQYVLDVTSSQILSTRSATTAALWGDTLWSATATPGVFTAADAKTGRVTSTVATDAPCVPDEIQVLGRWLYWSCGGNGPAGVWDGVSHKSVSVPAGHALLGDGYVLRHSGDQLVLTDVHTGSAAPDRVVAALPAGSYSDDRDMTWALDKYGDFLAYTDPQGTTHVLPSGVAPSPIGVLSSQVSALAGVSSSGCGWRPEWTLTRPATSWRVDLRQKGSTTVVKSFSGGATSRAAGLCWDGRDSRELLTPDGDYTWTLTLTPADRRGGTSSVTGTVKLSGGPEAPRDYTGDDIGDLLALTSHGGIDVRPGTGTGSVGPATLKATGWPSGSTIVPIDDLSGDKVNDLLVRDASGRLTRYDGAKGLPLSPASPSHLIGGGWNIYNLLTSPGDADGDGLPDLIARDTSGTLYLYRGTASGVFAPRTTMGYGYQIYDMIVGVHSMEAGLPQWGSLLARDKSGVLWEYQCNEKGRMNARLRIGAGWNVYNSLVGVGDLNHDGNNDLIARDKNGGLWRYNGLGNRRFAPRVQVGRGWQIYKSLV